LGCCFGPLLEFLFGLSGCLFLSRILLLLVGDLFQAVEFFSVQLVELGIDVLDGVLCARDDYVLTVGS